MKRNWLLLFTAICCFAMVLLPVSAAVVSPNSGFYVYDGAEVLSQETEQYILNNSRELQSKTGAQIVVVTIPSLKGQPLEEYATELFRQWGIGDVKKNNGVLLLCAVEDRKFRVEIGYGLEGDLPDGKTGRMQDEYIIPLLQEDQFDAGIKNGYNAFLQEVAAVYDVSISGEPAVSYGEESIDSALVICGVIACVLTFLGRKFLLKKQKKHLTAAFWIGEGAQLLILALVLQSLTSALIVLGFSFAFSFRLGFGRHLRHSHGGGGFGGGSGGFGGGFGGGGGRSGGGGSSRGF